MNPKSVIITGASSGIGKALAKKFGQNGFQLIITGRNQKALTKAVDDLQQQDIVVSGFCGDVCCEEDNKKMVSMAMNLYGGIDVLINNAGISMNALFEELDLDVMRKIIDINLFGTLYATYYCLPHIISSQGTIIGISSIAGYRGLPRRTGYSASKFAMNGFLESLRTELIDKKVHVLTACPGFTKSNIRKNALSYDGKSSYKTIATDEENKMMSAEVCAQHIYRAYVKKKKVIVLTRQGKLAVFLNKWLNGPMDRMVYNTLKKPN